MTWHNIMNISNESLKWNCPLIDIWWLIRVTLVVAWWLSSQNFGSGRDLQIIILLKNECSFSGVDMWSGRDTQPLQDDKKIWTLCTKRQWRCKNFSIISSSLVVVLVLELELELELVLALVLELELELALTLELELVLELELALGWLGLEGDELVPRGGEIIGVRGDGLVGARCGGWWVSWCIGMEVDCGQDLVGWLGPTGSG